MADDSGNGGTRREDSSLTRRETAADPQGTRSNGLGTRRESTGGTRREGGDHADALSSYTRANLPPELADRLRNPRDLGSGGEGFVILAEDATGDLFVVKWYYARLTFDDDATALLRQADPAHVVRILDFGESAHDGSRFEVQEYCELGTLSDLLRGGVPLDVREVVRELAAALEHIHGLRLDDNHSRTLLHLDVKPDNVLVRSLKPLDLVLGDFGLARMIVGSRHYTQRQQGSRPWAPPPGQAPSIGWDWWSLGMVVAEVAGGRHPFEVNGEMLGDAAISDLLAQGPVDLSAVADDRVRTLCQGLLTRRTDDRWGASQVQQWLDGRTVPVATDSGAIAARDRVVTFDGREFGDPVSLAAALQDDWDQAQELLIQRTDGGHLAQQVTPLLSAYNLDDALALMSDTLSSPPIRLINLLMEMDPQLRPIFRGRDIRPEAMAARLQDPTTRGAEVSLIEAPGNGVLSTRVLQTWQRLEGMSEAPRAESRLVAARVALSNYNERLQGLHDGGTVAKVIAYRLALQPGDEAAVRADLAKLDRSVACRAAWWAELAASDDVTSVVIALASHSAAVEEINAADLVEQTARETAQRQAREAAAQRAIADAAVRRPATVRTWRRWSIPLAMLGLIGLWVGVGSLTFPSNDPSSLLALPMDQGWVASVARWHADAFGEWVEPYNWLVLEPGSRDAIVLGAAGIAVGFVGVFLALMARRGSGIATDGRLSGPVRFLRGFSVTGVIGLGFAVAPWSVAGIVMLALGVGAIAVAILAFVIVIMLLGAMLSS